MRTQLSELELGISGALNVTEGMERLVWGVGRRGDGRRVRGESGGGGAVCFWSLCVRDGFLVDLGYCCVLSRAIVQIRMQEHDCADIRMYILMDIHVYARLDTWGIRWAFGCPCGGRIVSCDHLCFVFPCCFGGEGGSKELAIPPVFTFVFGRLGLLLLVWLALVRPGLDWLEVIWLGSVCVGLAGFGLLGAFMPKSLPAISTPSNQPICLIFNRRIHRHT